MTPKKEIKKVVVQMTGVTEGQIRQRMHEFQGAIEARSAPARAAQTTESQPPPPLSSRIESTEQRLEKRPFADNGQRSETVGRTGSGGGGDDGGGAVIENVIMNSNGTLVYADLNGEITGTV